jgi:hypothetical protein
MWEGMVSRDQAPALREQLQVVSQQLFEGQVRMRAYSPGLRPLEGFAPSPATLEDHYLLQVGRHGSRP